MCLKSFQLCWYKQGLEGGWRGIDENNDTPSLIRNKNPCLNRTQGLKMAVEWADANLQGLDEDF